MKVKLSTERKRARQKRRFIKIVKDNLKVVGVVEKNAMDCERWKRIICFDDHGKRRAERRTID